MNNPSYKELSTEELWTLCIQDNQEAFKEIYDREYFRLYNYGIKFYKSKAQVEDAIQDIFLNLWQKRHQRKDIQRLDFYLLKSVRYKLINLSAKANIIDIESANLSLMHSTANTEVPSSNPAVLQVQYLINQLPKNQQEALHLKYYQNLSNAEIAEFLQINYQSVSNLIYRAINSLKKKSAKKLSLK